MTLNSVDPQARRETMVSAFRDRFGRDPSLGVRAPGRVDLMGSHTDYNEGYVLTLPIDLDTWILAAPTEDDQVCLTSLNIDGVCDYSLGSRTPVEGWGRYAQGVTVQLADAGFPLTGFCAVVHGTVPIGSGLSSSASLEAAVSTLMEQLGGFALEKLEKAKLCQRAENQWVGVNCGILDQYSSILGEEGKALLLDCRTLTHTTARVPPELQPVICNTRAPRELSGSEYGERREQCEAGAAYFARLSPEISTLRDVSLHRFSEHRQDLPADVQKRSQFVIEEHARVTELAAALEVDDRAAIERISAESYVGARDLFEISVPAMQAMFDAMSAAPGVAGCRQAGAGFGGCMVALVEVPRVDEFRSSVEAVYEETSGIAPDIVAVHTAPGAGTLAIR